MKEFFDNEPTDELLSQLYQALKKAVPEGTNYSEGEKYQDWCKQNVYEYGLKIGEQKAIDTIYKNLRILFGYVRSITR